MQTSWLSSCDSVVEHLPTKSGVLGFISCHRLSFLSFLFCRISIAFLKGSFTEECTPTDFPWKWFKPSWSVCGKATTLRCAEWVIFFRLHFHQEKKCFEASLVGLLRTMSKYCCCGCYCCCWCCCFWYCCCCCWWCCCCYCCCCLFLLLLFPLFGFLIVILRSGCFVSQYLSCSAFCSHSLTHTHAHTLSLSHSFSVAHSISLSVFLKLTNIFSPKQKTL